MAVCKSCGAIIDGKQAFCPKCGAFVEEPEPDFLLEDGGSEILKRRRKAAKAAEKEKKSPVRSEQKHDEKRDEQKKSFSYEYETVMDGEETGKSDFESMDDDAVGRIGNKLTEVFKDTRVEDILSDRQAVVWGILGMIVPVAGIVFYFVWRKKKPRYSKSAGIGAIIGIVASFIL